MVVSMAVMSSSSTPPYIALEGWLIGGSSGSLMQGNRLNPSLESLNRPTRGGGGQMVPPPGRPTWPGGSPDLWWAPLALVFLWVEARLISPLILDDFLGVGLWFWRVGLRDCLYSLGNLWALDKWCFLLCFGPFSMIFTCTCKFTKTRGNG